MKKLLALLLVLSLVFSFTACCITLPDIGDKAPSLSMKDSPLLKEKIDFSELVVVDNEICLIKITKLEEDSISGFNLKVLLENKSADTTYRFSIDNAAINGVQASAYLLSEVTPGKKTTEEIDLYNSALEDLGIAFTDIELSFRVYDSEDWLNRDAIAKETVHIYPYGEEKAEYFVRDPQDSDTIIVDDEYVSVIVTGYEEDDFGGYTMNMYLLNKSDKNIMFTVDDVSVNGFMTNPNFVERVSAGKCAFSSLSWSKSTFEVNDITNIEEIEFILKAYNCDDIYEDNYINEVITLNP